ncbi:MAG: hypothetical protein Q8P51_19300 [Ignavibacteria bacterium]|nr:hypothetical protein [Ignavibacteria bacterium]
MTNLLSIKDLEPPMGDLATRQSLSFCRALWTAPSKGEDEAPLHRIIHARILQLHAPARLKRLGLKRTAGYHKCGSRQDLDWVTSFRILVWTGSEWSVLRSESDVPAPTGPTLWFDLGNTETTAVIIEARRCGIDNWWTSWNLASGAFVLEGEPLGGIAPRKEQTLKLEKLDLDGVPSTVLATSDAGEVRFRTRFLEVGFRLNRAGFSYLALDEEGQRRTGANVLKLQPGSFYQGVHVSQVGAVPAAGSVLRHDVQGSTRVEGNSVTYDMHFKEAGQRYVLKWTIEEDRLRLHAERIAERTIRAWRSSAWMIGLSSLASTSHVLGKIIRKGETGVMDLPTLIHLPRFGTLKVTASGGDALWRSDSNRPLNMTTSELKLGEVLQPEGDYLLRSGHFVVDIEMKVEAISTPLRDETPVSVLQAVKRCSLTALTYRADTGTLSNNGNSIHCPLCMDNWSAITTRMDPILPNLRPVDLLRDSLERWLDGGPGYGSGPLLQDGKVHEAEDEYLMTGTAGLLGLAEYLRHSGTVEWVSLYRGQIQKKLKQMRARDLDKDGLIESRYRTGVSGTGQWSTTWMDVVSFGWKDSWTNALLYPALTSLATVLPTLGHPDLAEGLSAWASLLRKNYLPTFLNSKTGWLAGWRCAEDKLHDYGFLAVNGAAVCGGVLDDNDARSIIENLWLETRRVRIPNARYGLPISLWPIPDEDLADIMQGYPHGFYGNGACTHSQTRHFVDALYLVGMNKEADFLLEHLCSSLADGLVYGACKSGLDARYWDGWPCGYEGLLTDQFGILASAFKRYGKPQTAV